jgi:hypothetical protein
MACAPRRASTPPLNTTPPLAPRGTPQGPTLDVSDGAGLRIGRIAIASQAVSTIAGSAGAAGGANCVGDAAAFSHPRGLALDTSLATLYVVEEGGHRVRAVALAVSALASEGVAGPQNGRGAAAAFSAPTAIAAAPSGSLLVADTAANRVRLLLCEPCPAGAVCAPYDDAASFSAGAFCPYAAARATTCSVDTFNPAPAATGTGSPSGTPSPMGTPTAPASPHLRSAHGYAELRRVALHLCVQLGDGQHLHVAVGHTRAAA